MYRAAAAWRAGTTIDEITHNNFTTHSTRGGQRPRGARNGEPTEVPTSACTHMYIWGPTRHRIMLQLFIRALAEGPKVVNQLFYRTVDLHSVESSCVLPFCNMGEMSSPILQNGRLFWRMVLYSPNVKKNDSTEWSRHSADEWSTLFCRIVYTSCPDMENKSFGRMELNATKWLMA
eukprot:6184820-Pleurochrysis_carterae.AAC.1